MFASLEPPFPAHNLGAYGLVGKWIADDAMSMNSRFVAKGVFTNYCLVWLDNYTHRV
jgi:hypothetical protein